MIQIDNILALEEAAYDIDAAEIFYEKTTPGLGNYFREQLIADIESLRDYAGIHPKKFGVYRLLSKKFPYGIYYIIQGKTVVIMAVLDLRQKPKNIMNHLQNRQTEE